MQSQHLNTEISLVCRVIIISRGTPKYLLLISANEFTPKKTPSAAALPNLYGQGLTKCCVSYIISHHRWLLICIGKCFPCWESFDVYVGHLQLQTDTQLTTSARSSWTSHFWRRKALKQAFVPRWVNWFHFSCQRSHSVEKGPKRGMTIVFVKVYSLWMSVSMMEPLLMKKTTRQAIKSHELTIRF